MEHSPLSDAMIDEAGRIFSALSDPSRLKLLRLLMAAAEPVSQRVLAESAGLSQANASKHLICLMQAGLVEREKDGNFCYFRISGSLAPDVCRLVRNHVVNRTQSAYQSLR